MARPPRLLEVELNLRGVEVSGTWEPNSAERKAAWELYVELITRISVAPLRESEGLLREALSSLYSLFGSTRDILRQYGPEIAEPKGSGQYSFGILAVSMLNFGIRPLLARWHPILEDWENRRPEAISRRDHERSWPDASTLRTVLQETQRILSAYAGLLAAACGVPNLLDAVPTADPMP
ncbi:hypothetical protein ACQEVG_11875 [Streptomyces sp. CA-135486]|uniref:hypothetical protein n=1 Tax=Streptomyces sp. CA-135486 TaxID=3240049 RepID=UPI003D9391CE